MFYLTGAPTEKPFFIRLNLASLGNSVFSGGLGLLITNSFMLFVIC